MIHSFQKQPFPWFAIHDLHDRNRILRERNNKTPEQQFNTAGKNNEKIFDSSFPLGMYLRVVVFEIVSLKPGRNHERLNIKCCDNTSRIPFVLHKNAKNYECEQTRAVIGSCDFGEEWDKTSTTSEEWQGMCACARG
jgi:hypothetical protein